MKFRLRIDGEDTDPVKRFCERYVSYVIVAHRLPHGNPHFHAFIEDKMSLSIDAFRQRVKRTFNPAQRSDYSVKVCDEDKQDEYISYLFNTKHGNVATLVAHNFDDSYINGCKESAESISTDFAKRKAERVRKGPTIYDIAEEVASQVDALHNPDLTIGDYTRITIDTLHKHRKTCEPNMVIKIVSTAKSFKDKDFLVKKVQFYFQEQ